MKLLRYLDIEFAFIKFNIIQRMQYKVNFFLSTIYELAETLLNILYFILVLARTQEIAGWGEGELVFATIYAFLIDSMCTCFFIEALTEVPSMIENGKLDLMITKPISKTYLLAFSKPNVAQFINIMIGFIGLGVTSIIYNFQVNVMSLLCFCGSVILSVILMYFVLSIVIYLAFWIIKVGNFWLIVFTFHMAGTRPAGIYPKVLKVFMSLIIPSLVVLNIPTEILSKNQSYLLLKYMFPITVLFYLIYKIVVRLGFRHYTSAGG